MKRGQMLLCADVDEGRFKVLRQREHLPFEPPRGDDYTIDHAFRLRLMLDLVGGEADDLSGLLPSVAAPLVAEAMRRWPVHPVDQFTPAGWWLGVVVLERPDGTRWAETYAGDLESFAAWLAETRRFETPGKVPGVPMIGRHAAVRVFLANASRAASFVRDRAEDIGASVETDA